MKKLFREIKRVVSQYFETEYWYRCRKFNDGRAVSTLNDTWNGHNTLLNWQIMKVEHMIYNLRKYGNEVESYIDSPDFLKYGDDLDIAFGYLYSIEKLKESKSLRWCGKDHWIQYNEINNCWDVKNRVLVETIPADKIPKSERLYTLEGDDVETAKFVPCDREVYKWETKVSFGNIKDLEDWMNKNDCDGNFKHQVIMYEQTIHIAPKDYHMITPQLRDHIRGNRRKLRDLWLYRKLLKKLNDMDFSFSEPYNSKTNEILAKYRNTDNEEAKRKELEDLYDEYKEDRRAIMRQIEQLWIERSEFWWD